MKQPAHSLKSYERKRDFARSPEPRGAGRAPSAEGPIFCVQRHDARRLHYDLRLEIGGVLKSWAVPKGPSLDPETQRLAVPTEDHPLEYADFEGVIPRGEYGGGTVLLWDHGTYRVRGDAEEAYAEGKLVFELEGERLRGGFTLVRTGDKAWLLHKRRDAFAEEGHDEPDLSLAKPAKLPIAFRPTLATLAERAPEGMDYLHEIKLDGYRIIARVEHGAKHEVRLLTRSGLDWTSKLPTIAEAAAKLPDGIYDGEALVYDAEGRSDFSALVEALRRGADEDISLVFFDMPFSEGLDLRDVPLEARKARLLTALGDAKHRPLGYASHVVGRGPAFLKLALERDLEGIISKKRDSTYRSGRHRDWLKIRGEQRQELIVVGYTPLEGSKTQLGALLLATREGEALRYAGKVGTGFDDAARRFLRTQLEELRRALTPLTYDVSDLPHAARWVEPSLVAEVRFREWTPRGRLRQPVFIALREDKPVEEVVREEPLIALSKPDKVLYPKPGVTKHDLATYYALVAPRMMPFILGRPLMLLRSPHGVGSKHFYQKHPSGEPPEGFERFSVTESAGTSDYLVVRESSALQGFAQLAALEVHIWGSRTDELERPDRLVFDLDPGPGVHFDAVVALAQSLRARLAPLESFALVTGGKGVHVVVPLKRTLSFEQLRAFSADIAKAFAREEPERFVAVMSKKARQGRIFIDYLRNGRGATAVCPYSTRARPGASLAMPVSWSELSSLHRADAFTIADAEARMREADPWDGYAVLQQQLSAERMERARHDAGR